MPDSTYNPIDARLPSGMTAMVRASATFGLRWFWWKPVYVVECDDGELYLATERGLAHHQADRRKAAK